MPNLLYYCVLDFEATCWEGERRPTQEIIEFPSVLIRVDTFRRSLTQIGEFHQYVRPVIHPELSEFCTSLTGITQDQVSSAKPIEEVYEEHHRWLQSNVEEGAPCHIVTCGNWDLATMLPMEIANKGLHRRHVYSHFINIKYEFERFYHRRVGSMPQMLEKCGLELQGRHHSGIDDTRNISRVLLKMLEDGYSDPRVQKVKR